MISEDVDEDIHVMYIHVVQEGKDTDVSRRITSNLQCTKISQRITTLDT